MIRTGIKHTLDCPIKKEAINSLRTAYHHGGEMIAAEDNFLDVVIPTSLQLITRKHSSFWSLSGIQIV